MKADNQDFNCSNCDKTVRVNEFMGTKNRNHCPHCLWSKHVDDKVAGDRQAKCQGNMRPLGLTFKDEGVDKYGQPRQGELMLIHECVKCGKVSINRIAADDNADLIMQLLGSEKLAADNRQKIDSSKIKILNDSDSDQVKTLLFGKRS